MEIMLNISSRLPLNYNHAQYMLTVAEAAF